GGPGAAGAGVGAVGRARALAESAAAGAGRGCDLAQLPGQRAGGDGAVAGLLPLGPLARGEDDGGRSARSRPGGGSAGAATGPGRGLLPGAGARPGRGAGARRGLIRIRVQTHGTPVISTPDSIRGRDLPFRRSLAYGSG